MPNRIDSMLKLAAKSGRPAMAPFLTIGYPDTNTSIEIATALLNSGVELLELGIPFSDPLAEGPTIQKSSFQALQQGVNLNVCLDVLRKVREQNKQAGLLLMGYYNPLFKYGIESAVTAIAASGGDGLIIADMPTEESSTLRKYCSQHNIHLIPLLAPTSTDDRIEQSCKQASGFIYCVSVAGVTGARANLQHSVRDLVARIRRYTTLPILVGFGISTPEHVAEVGTFADGVVVGSALIQAIENGANKSDAVETAREFVEGLRPVNR